MSFPGLGPTGVFACIAIAAFFIEYREYARNYASRIHVTIGQRYFSFYLWPAISNVAVIAVLISVAFKVL